MIRIDRDRNDLTPATQIKAKHLKPQREAAVGGTLCGILSYKNTDGTYDYYDETANGCVYVYLLNPDGSVAAGYPAQCQAGQVLGCQIPYSIGCDCSHP